MLAGCSGDDDDTPNITLAMHGNYDGTLTYYSRSWSYIDSENMPIAINDFGSSFKIKMDDIYHTVPLYRDVSDGIAFDFNDQHKDDYSFIGSNLLL